MCIVRQEKQKKTQKTQRTHNPKNNTISPDYYKIMTSCSNHSVNNKQNLSHSWRRRSHRSHKSKLEDHSLCVVCKLCFHSLFGYVQAPKPFEVLRKYWWLHQYKKKQQDIQCAQMWQEVVTKSVEVRPRVGSHIALPFLQASIFSYL